MTLKLDELAARACGWLRESGEVSDIVISSRIRLARNLADFPFIRRCSEQDRAAVEKACHQAIAQVENWRDLIYVDVSTLAALDRQFLVERQLISRELAEASGARSVAIEPQETFSLMINEEDHLRLQVIQGGLNLQSAWERINEIDNQLDARLNYAFHDRLGFLTACPTNVGTGMRVSVMLHLPALVITQEIEKAFKSLQKIGLAVRGLYGEGSQAMGDFYQISNQITLGRSEEDLIKQVSDVIPLVIGYERHARAFLVKESRKDLHDRVSRAYGILCTAQTISSEETLHLLSSVRMGVNLGLIQDLDISAINRLFIHTQPAHLQKIRGGQLETADRNVERAVYLRSHLRRPGATESAN